MNRHARRMQSATEATGAPHALVSKPQNLQNILCVVVSYRGVSPATVENLDVMKEEALSKNIGFAFKVIGRLPLDLARNESWTFVRSTSATAALFLDDDVQVDPTWLPNAVRLLSENVPVVTAPTRLRRPGTTIFNVALTELPHFVSGQRVARTIWTGFGAVLVTRHIIDYMHEKYVDRHYKSTRNPGKTSCDLFSSTIATNLWTSDDPNERHFVLDDIAWSLRARDLDIPIYATIDVDTTHDGLAGNFGRMLDACILCKKCLGDKKAAHIETDSILRCAKCSSTTNLFNLYTPWNSD